MSDFRPPADITPLRPALEAGELVLTANQRLARALEQAWCPAGAAGGQVWERPRIHALDHWFARQWQELRDAAFAPALDAVLATPAVEQLLWRRVIEDHPESSAMDAAGFARLAHSARQLLERWEVDPRALADGQRGSELFAAWLPRWRQAMARRHLLTREQSLDLLLAGRRAGVLSPAGTAHLVGFAAALPPREQRVLAGLCGRVVDRPPGAARGTARLVAAADPDAELSAAAHWAVAQLAGSPQRRIAIVIPDLAASRGRVERILRDLLTPAHCLPDRGWSPPPFNISAGQALAELPLPRTALALLGLHAGPLPLGTLCALLHDPHWGDAAAELRVRARAEQLLRERGAVAPTAADLRQALSRAEADCQCPGLVAPRLQAAAELFRRLPPQAGFGTWANRIRDLLQRFDWPGRRPLDSHEFQQLQHWQALLDACAALAVSGERPSWPEVLAELHRLAAATPFQPQTPDARLQVLGVLEATGLSFDALWVTGMTDTRWPEALAPHPLLPAALQRHLGMPRAQAQQELAIARTRIAQLRAAAPEVLFSYPVQDGEVGLQPCAALRALPTAAAEEWDPAARPLVAALRGAAALETLAWGDAPPCRPEEIGSGGSTRLRDQSGSPFNAFAIWRLGARPLPEPEPGLSRAERGELVHRALELFWAPLAGQEALRALGDGDRRQRLRAAIDSALDQLARSRPELHGARLRDLETACLLRHLEAWLAAELERPPFTLVAREQRLDLDLAGLPVHLRIDRIDRLADGRLLLLDYKTGTVRAGGWSGERPEEPQLPLYALAAPEPLAGLALARVRSDEPHGCGLIGVADVELPGCRPLAERGLPGDWPSALAHWRRVLGALAREFLQGTATICHYHRGSAERDSLKALNRLPELEQIQSIVKET